jgi:hypothetical protein
MNNTADTGKRLVRVEINACKLNMGTSLSADATQLVVSQENVFSEGDTVLIGDEDILLGTPTDIEHRLTFNGCTRAQNDTLATTHTDGQFVMAATGRTLLSHTFVAEDFINMVIVTGFAEALFRVTMTEADASVSYSWLRTTPYVMTAMLPCRRRAPGAGATLLIEAWTEYSQDGMSAEIKS